MTLLHRLLLVLCELEFDTPALRSFASASKPSSFIPVKDVMYTTLTYGL